MKTFLSILTLLISSFAIAAMPAAQHKNLFKTLVGKTGRATAEQERSFYFAGYGEVLQLDNTKDGISLSFGKPSDESFILDLSPSKDHEVKVEAGSKGEVVVNITDYFDNEGQRDVFSTSKATLRAETFHKISKVGVQAEESTYWDFDYQGEGSGKWRRLETPELKKADVDTTFVLSLSPHQMKELGEQAAKKVSEDRKPEPQGCSMDSEYLIKCEFSLETDYTPDTLHSVFSIKDGKVSELLDAYLEYGC